MDRATQQKLNAINRDFYHEHAASFSGTRALPWSGWKRVHPHVVEARSAVGSLRVLDVGCGNGRFARFLADQVGGSIDYLGLDVSAPLLEEARSQLPTGFPARFQVVDLLDADCGLGEIPGPFAFVAAFGLLHHIPGADTRRELMRELGRRVAPGGRLALTFWNFDNPRFEARRIAWPASIDPARLEAGDRLLRWGADADSGCRYCHFADDSERDVLIEASGLAQIDRFEAEGALNDYRILCNPEVR